MYPNFFSRGVKNYICDVFNFFCGLWEVIPFIHCQEAFVFDDWYKRMATCFILTLSLSFTAINHTYTYEWAHNYTRTCTCTCTHTQSKRAFAFSPFCIGFIVHLYSELLCPFILSNNDLLFLINCWVKDGIITSAASAFWPDPKVEQRVLHPFH
jgi:hypothetical protein